MKKHWKYLKYVLRHKAFVFYAGLKTGAPIWRLLIHDWSKFTPAEWGPYANYFYGEHKKRLEKLISGPTVDAFNRAWLHHQHRNPHHWQHFLLVEDNGGTKLLPIPEDFLREMVADWYGAGRAITGKWEAHDWYEANGWKMILHSTSRVQAEELLFNINF